MPDSLAPVLTGLGLGIALAGAPGPVQAVLLSETLRGGTRRGFTAMAGANLAWGILLLAVALGLSITTPGEIATRMLKFVGGGLLIYFGIDGLRGQPPGPAAKQPVPPLLRGVLAVLLNPGAWLFLATVVTSLVATATQTGGTPNAVLAVIALLLGVALGDGTLVVVGGTGVRKAANPAFGHWLQRALAVVLIVLGLGLLLSGLVS